MSYLPSSKFGNCTQCPSTNVACTKVGKNLFCIPCHRKNKGQQYINTANEKERVRRESAQPTKTTVSEKLKTSVRSLADKSIVKDKVGIGSKSELLRQADKLFADFIKKRDVKNGKFTCPCCHKTYFADKEAMEDISDEDTEVFSGVDSDDRKIINCMHFCDRDIYSLRFDEDNAAAGCCYCNKKMHLQPKGIEYQNFRNYLVGLHGEEAIAEMELQHRKINKLEITQLKNIIEHYSL